MGRSKDIASGSKFVDTTGDTMTGDLVVSKTSGATINVNTALNGATSKVILHEGTTASPANGATLEYNGSTNVFSVGVGSDISTKRLSIGRDTGAVTMPYQPFIECKGNSNSSYSYTADQVVAHWTNKTTPVGITRSGGRFTVPVAGKYLFCFTLYSYTTSAGHYRNRININGSTHNLTQMEVSSGARIDTHFDHTLMSSHILNMSANDYVEIIASSAQVMYRGDVHNALSMMLIG